LPRRQLTEEVRVVERTRLVASSATHRRGGREMKYYYVYVLKSEKDGKLYVGKTTDLVRRVKKHENGEVKATKGRRPLTLVFYEAFKNKTDAGGDELFFKTGYGREVLREKLKNCIR
jgi:putative endonuclease